MTGGLFAKLALTNIRKNRKIYGPYIFACVGVVMMFYIISSLAHDPDVLEFYCGRSAAMILNLGSIVVSIFAIIFLFYTSSFLMKRRKTELGLYNVLGLGKGHIIKILAWETLMVWGSSLVMGLVSGLVFGKLAQVGLLRMMGGGVNYNFNFSAGSILATAALFAGIFGIIYIKNVFEIYRMKTIDLLYSAKQGEKQPRANYVLAIAGVVMLAAGYYIALAVKNPLEAITFFFFAVILVIAGTYSCMISGSVALLSAMKKNKNYYYKTSHFISTSSMMFRMKKHGAGLASICILATMVLVMISSTACLYIGADKAMGTTYPRDIEVQYTLRGSNEETLQAASSDLNRVVTRVMNDENLKPAGEIEYSLCSFYGKPDDTDGTSFRCSVFNGNTDVISLSLVTLEDYNRSFSMNESLAADEVLVFGKGIGYDKPVISFGGEELKVKGEASGLVMRGIDAADMSDCLYLVVADESVLMRIYDIVEKEAMEDSCPGPQLVAYRAFDIMADDGSRVQDSERLNQVQETIYKIQNEGYDGTFSGSAQYSRMDFGIRNRANAGEIYGLYGGLFFLGILLSILFMGATVIIMYYKQVIEGYDDKERFDIMQKVGMSRNEVKKTINSQVLTVFFIPLLGAGVHMAFAFPIIALMLRVFMISNTSLLAGITLGAFAAFALFYVASYLITSRAYYRVVAAEQ